MAESVMGQGMETWLKKKCVSMGRPLFHISHLVNKLQDSLFLEDFMEAKRTVDNMVHIGRVPPHLIPKLQGIVDNYKNSIPDTPERESAIRDILRLRANIEDYTMEQVVECQCGKPHGSSSNPGGNTMAELKSQIYRQMDDESKAYSDYSHLALQAMNLGKDMVAHELKLIADDEKRHHDKLHNMLKELGG